MDKPVPERPKRRFQWLAQKIYGLPADQLRGQEALLRFRDELSKNQHQKEDGAWTNLTAAGDLGGRVRCLAMGPDDRTLYAGSASGGLWRNERAANGKWQGWEVVENSSHFAIGALATDPRNPGCFYVGTGEPYVWLLYRGVGVLRYDPSQGEPWKPIGPTSLSYVAQILVHYDNKSQRILYCAGSEGLFSTQDEGETWQTETFGNVTGVAVDSEGSLLVGIYGLGLFRRRRDESRWEPIEVDAELEGKSLYRVLIHAHEVGGTEHYFARLGHQVYASKDRGRTWSDPEVVLLPDTDRDWASYLWVHPDGSGQMLIGGKQLKSGQLQSTPAPRVRLGEQSTPDLSRRTFIDHHDAVSSAKGEVFIACDGGVYGAADLASRWEYLPGLDVSQFYDLAVSPHDLEVLGGGTQDLGTWLRRADGTWQRILAADGGHLCFDPKDPNGLWAQEQQNRIYRIQLDPFEKQGLYGSGLQIDEAPFIGIVVADARHKNVVYTGRQHVFRMQWDPKREPNENKWRAISPLFGGDISALVQHPVGGNLFVGTSTGNLWWSRSRGVDANKKRWKELTDVYSTFRKLPKRFVTRIVIDPENSNGVYVCFGGREAMTRTSENEEALLGQIFRGVRSRGSKDWVWEFEDCSGEGETALPNASVHGLAFHAETAWAATDFGVFKSQVGVWEWAKEPGLPLVPCFDLVLSHKPSEDVHLLRVATHGRGIFECRL